MLIEATHSRFVTAVNTALIDLYWRIGQHVSRRIAEEAWGQGTVAALAEYIRAPRPNARGFSASNLWRMTQVYETYIAVFQNSHRWCEVCRGPTTS